MSRYAANTTVSVEKSVAEIKRTLDRYGADQFAYGEDSALSKASVQFSSHNRHIRFILQLPHRDSEEFTLTPTGKDRSYDAALKSWEQSCRQRWRAFALDRSTSINLVPTMVEELREAVDGIRETMSR